MSELSFSEVLEQYCELPTTDYPPTEKENLKALWGIIAAGVVENDFVQLDGFGTFKLGEPHRVGSDKFGHVDNVRKVTFQASPAFEELLAKIWLEKRGEVAEFR